VRESAASAKRFCFMFGAKPAQSETSVRAAAKRRQPGRGRSGMMGRSSDKGEDWMLEESPTYHVKYLAMH
jgi:hypothetical protein